MQPVRPWLRELRLFLPRIAASASASISLLQPCHMAWQLKCLEEQVLSAERRRLRRPPVAVTVDSAELRKAAWRRCAYPFAGFLQGCPTRVSARPSLTACHRQVRLPRSFRRGPLWLRISSPSQLVRPMLRNEPEPHQHACVFSTTPRQDTSICAFSRGPCGSTNAHREGFRPSSAKTGIRQRLHSMSLPRAPRKPRWLRRD